MLLANAGIPMLAWHAGPAFLVFLPIVAVESLITWAIMRRSPLIVFKAVGIANAASTFVGVPMAWVFMVIVELATVGGGADRHYNTPWAAFQWMVFGSAWLPPDEGNAAWMIAAATVVLLVPYFFVSVVVERLVERRLFGTASRSRLAAATWVSNLVSYGGLLAAALYSLRMWLTAHRGRDNQPMLWTAPRRVGSLSLV